MSSRRCKRIRCSQLPTSIFVTKPIKTDVQKRIVLVLFEANCMKPFPSARIPTAAWKFLTGTRYLEKISKSHCHHGITWNLPGMWKILPNIRHHSNPKSKPTRPPPPRTLRSTPSLAAANPVSPKTPATGNHQSNVNRSSRYPDFVKSTKISNEKRRKSFVNLSNDLNPSLWLS